MQCDYPAPREDKCLIISEIHFETGANELLLESDCRTSDTTAYNTRFYYEPADLERNIHYTPINVEYMQL